MQRHRVYACVIPCHDIVRYTHAHMTDVLLRRETRDLDSQYEVRLTRECRLLAQPLGRQQAAASSDVYLYAEHPYLLRLVGAMAPRLHLRIVNASTHTVPAGLVFEKVLVRREDLLSTARAREPEPAYRLYVPSLAAAELLAATHRPDSPADAPCFEIATDEEHILCHGKHVPRLRVHLMLHVRAQRVPTRTVCSHVSTCCRI
jgi:hypothetical protein